MANKGFEEKEKHSKSINDRPLVMELFKNLKTNMTNLENLLEDCSGAWGIEDFLYRFYHQSYKVYNLQGYTTEIVSKLQALLPGVELNEYFRQIVKEGTGKTFSSGDNLNWLAVTRPIIEAFFHAHYFLEMAVRYGKELDFPPKILPSGWAALLYLYNLR